MNKHIRSVGRTLSGVVVGGVLAVTVSAPAFAADVAPATAKSPVTVEQATTLTYLVGVNFIDEAGAKHTYAGGLSVTPGPRDEMGNEGLTGQLTLQALNRSDPRLPALEVRGASAFVGDRSTVSIVARTADPSAPQVIVTLKGVASDAGFSGIRPGDAWLAGSGLPTWRSGIWSAVQE